jgi:hypothetical protein
MKHSLFVALVISATLAVAGPASAQSAKNFEGHWKNKDPRVGDLIELDITVRGTEVDVKAWGDCKPNPCDVGHTEAHMYAAGKTGNLETNARGLMVTYSQGFATRTLVIEPHVGSELSVSMFTLFTDRSGRTNYVENSTFKR